MKYTGNSMNDNTRQSMSHFIELLGIIHIGFQATAWVLS